MKLVKCLLIGLIATGGSLAAAEERHDRWQAAFGSSPAHYEPLSDVAIDRLAKRVNIPRVMIAQMQAKPPVTGTIRFRLTLTAPGERLRVRLSNEGAATPMVISSASIGRAGERFAARSLTPLTFGGKPGIAIPAGAPALSDPVTLAEAGQRDVVVSLNLTSPYAPEPRGSALAALAAGDQVNRPTLEAAKDLVTRPIVTGVDVLVSRRGPVIVAMGDSITDGNRATLPALHGWPEQLSRRLEARSNDRSTVVNAGISGNRLLTSGWGDAGLVRLDRDVLRIDGVTHLILLEGTNDIGMSGSSLFGDNPPLSADDLIAGYRQAIARAHARGVKVLVGTITPFGGSISHFSPDREAVRTAVNTWIRTSGEPDDVIDFDRMLRDPAAPSHFAKAFDSGDHLHPNDAGYRAMGDGIDLALFR